jgi:PAS domain S-box-containing protein
METTDQQSMTKKENRERVTKSDPSYIQFKPTTDADDQSSATALVDEIEDYAIIVLDQNGVIKSWNKGAQKIKGYRPEEIIGMNYRIFYPKEDKEHNLSESLLEEAAKNGRTSYEGWRVKKDGTRFWGTMTLTALHKPDGSLRGFVKVTRDLTEKKIAEDTYSNFVEELKLKNQELKESEQKYHKMVSEVVDYAIILLDRDGKILDWNKGAENLKGYTAKEIVGKHFRMFYPKEEKEKRLPEQLLAKAVENGSVMHEGWRIKKNGTRFWGNITITALHDDDDNIIGFSKVTRDLTERKIAEDRVSNLMEELRQANDSLKQSEERYHKMIEEVQDYAILLLDEFGNIQNWNTGAEVIKGYTPQEIIGKNFQIFYTKEDQINHLPQKLLGQARAEGKVTHEGWRVRKDGTVFWGSVVITALHGASGDIIGFSKVTRDLTERKAAEDAMERSAAQLELKNKSLERLNTELASFTYVASHDLKEPLRKIQVYASMAEDPSTSPERLKEYVWKMKNSAHRMQTLIDNLLAYSQVSNDHASKFEIVDLNETLNAVRSDLEIVIREKNVAIVNDELPSVKGIDYQLHQLFLNLISNGIKFSKVGVSPRIEIRAGRLKGPELPGALSTSANVYHHLSFKDNGIGFAQDVSNKIFEVFQRLNPREAFSGSGVGLAIVKKIAENHHGIVAAEGQPAEGATFHVYLPI